MTDTIDGFLEDLFAVVDGVGFRRMFGGIGIFRGEVMFGLVVDGEVYLRADATTSQDFVMEGSGPFTYMRSGRPVSLSYWQVPARLLDEPDEFRVWASAALQVAVKAGSGRKPRRRAKEGHVGRKTS